MVRPFTIAVGRKTSEEHGKGLKSEGICRAFAGRFQVVGVTDVRV
jgi:hypothetical protein